jgi:hypothetical protein
MNLEARDMIEAVTHLLRRGYDHEYRIREGQLYDLTADKPVAASDARVDSAMRFEGRLKHLRDRRPESRQQGPVDRRL